MGKTASSREARQGCFGQRGQSRGLFPVRTASRGCCSFRLRSLRRWLFEMSDEESDVNEQYDVLLAAHQNMNGMFAENCTLHDATFNSFDANDKKLDNAVLRWYALFALHQLNDASGERGDRLLGRATRDAERAMEDEDARALARWNANQCNSPTESDDESDDESDGYDGGGGDERADDTASGKRSRRQ